MEDLPPPSYPEPSTDTYASVENFTAYLARVWNWRAPEAETYNTRTVAPDGRVGAMKTSPEIPAEIIKRIEVPDYEGLKAPAHLNSFVERDAGKLIRCGCDTRVVGDP